MYFNNSMETILRIILCQRNKNAESVEIWRVTTIAVQMEQN